MMKRIKTLVLLILTVLLVAGVLCGCAVQTGEQPGISSLPHITIGSDTYPPFVYLDNNGDPTGIDVEIAQAICQLAKHAAGQRDDITAICFRVSAQ